ncbi:MAG: hypothetical protein HY913_04540 [Desulfomonile tiedjei]|nr:hypothetical protein [Desulfomonile tiedjei]
MSGEWAEELRQAFLDLDETRIESLLATVDELGPQVSEAIGDKAEAILVNVQQNAHAFWMLHAQEILRPGDVKDYDKDYQRYLAQVQARQVKNFVETHPNRILNPEIQRQLQYLQESRLTRSIDLQYLNERLTRMLKQERYWEGMSDVHVARFWHADGILLGHENGVKVGIITGPDDKRACPVCIRMLGTHVYFDRAKEKIERDLKIEDPGEYVAAWKFPRIPDIDNISREAVEKQGFLPPFHSRCRHGVSWFHK